MTNAAHLRGSAWLNFPRVACERWHHGNLVLLGDAAHTAHFSIGSGTKLALEDAIGLADALHADHDLERALEAYQDERQVEVLKLQSAARNSTEWFENGAALRPFRADAVRLFAAHPQPARQPREPAPARPHVARGHGALVRRARGPAAGADGRCRRCSRRSACASWSSPTASSSRRWRCTRPRTACRAISTWCISARARRAGPGWSSPR